MPAYARRRRTGCPCSSTQPYDDRVARDYRKRA